MICNRRSIPHLCGVGAWGSRNPHVFWYFSQEKYDKSQLCDLPKHNLKGTKLASSPMEGNYSFVSTQRDVRGPSPTNLTNAVSIATMFRHDAVRRGETGVRGLPRITIAQSVESKKQLKGFSRLRCFLRKSRRNFSSE